MRAAFAVAALAIGVAVSGCGLKSVTRQDRVAASVAASKMKDGTVLTEAQVAMLDQDQTYECHKEQRVGSHIPKLTCRSLRRLSEEEERTQHQLLMMETSATPGGGGKGEGGGKNESPSGQ